MSAQTNKLAIKTGGRVALEVIWTGVLAIGFGNFRSGDQMRGLRPIL
jgi:hypothetical protein